MGQRSLKRRFKNFKLIENTTYQNLSYTEKAVQKVKFIAFNTFITKEERSKTSNLSLYCARMRAQ